MSSPRSPYPSRHTKTAAWFHGSTFKMDNHAMPRSMCMYFYVFIYMYLYMYFYMYLYVCTVTRVYIYCMYSDTDIIQLSIIPCNT